MKQEKRGNPEHFYDDLYTVLLETLGDTHAANSLLNALCRRFGGEHFYFPKRVKLSSWEEDVRRAYYLGDSLEEICRKFNWSKHYGRKKIYRILGIQEKQNTTQQKEQSSLKISESLIYGRPILARKIKN